MYSNTEFLKICDDILSNSDFNKLKFCKHHGITRYEHSLRVAYYTYKFTKKFHFNYVDCTRAALLHDFFTDEVNNLGGFKRLVEHPKYALINSKKYYELTSVQEDIIIKHMFPITLIPPKYIESYIVDFIDDVASIYERIHSTGVQLSGAFNALIVLITGIFIK